MMGAALLDEPMSPTECAIRAQMIQRLVIETRDPELLGQAETLLASFTADYEALALPIDVTYAAVPVEAAR